MKLTCAHPACDRPRMRQRDGQWWCSWHPTEQPPSLDLLSGKLRDPSNPAKVKPERTSRSPRRDPDLELQRDLEQMERTDPAVAAAAASYDTTADKIRAKRAPQPAPAPYRAPGRVVPVGRCPRPRPATVPPAEVAAAYEQASDRVEQTAARELDVVDVQVVLASDEVRVGLSIEQCRGAQHRAGELGLGLSEYVRRLIVADLGELRS